MGFCHTLNQSRRKRVKKINKKKKKHKHKKKEKEKKQKRKKTWKKTKEQYKEEEEEIYCVIYWTLKENPLGQETTMCIQIKKGRSLELRHKGA